MNKNQLEYFITAFECRNIQAAAERLFISHQGLSRVIRSLERELGQELFVRSNRGIEPTEFACSILPHVRKLLDTYAHIEGIQALAGQSKAFVSVYALDHVLGYLGSDFVLTFHEKYPDTTLSVTDSTDELALHKLMSGECDYAIINGPIDNTGVYAEPLFYSRYCLRINRNNPLAEKEDIGWSDLAGQKLIGRGREYSCFRKNIDSLILGSSIPIDIPLETSDEGMIRELVEKNLAVAVTYDFSAVNNCGQSTVIRYPNDKKQGQNIYLVSRTGRQLSKSAHDFRSMLLEWITAHPEQFSKPVVK